jgi:uncharacterized protein YjiS (DUF1127 family)
MAQILLLLKDVGLTPGQVEKRAAPPSAKKS